MIIKLVLLGGLVGLGVMAYRSSLNSRSAALRRLSGVLLLCGAAVAVVWPDAVSHLAVMMGVGRGSDLVLYLLAVVSLFVWLSLYRRIHDLEHRLVLLTRRIALHDAEHPPTTVGSDET